MRVSTLVMCEAFVVVGILRRDKSVFLWWWAWLAGFETVFQLTTIAFGRPYGRGWIVYVILGLATVPFVTWRGVRPYLPLMGAVAVLWIVWVATGFHVNEHTTVGLDPLGEALNEGTKTLWAVAYLWPLRPREPSLWRGRRRFANPSG